MIMLGNQTPDQIEKRLHIKLSTEDKEELLTTWHQKADNIAEGMWHCFDIPFMLVCGDMKTACKWRDIFMKYDLGEAEMFQISWVR